MVQKQAIIKEIDLYQLLSFPNCVKIMKIFKGYMMFKLPENSEKFTPQSATVEFAKFQKDGFLYVMFDTSRCIPPEPMVNAMVALSMIGDQNTKVIMINHKSPAGLLEKIKNDFLWEEIAMDDGNVMIVFSKKC